MHFASTDGVAEMTPSTQEQRQWVASDCPCGTAPEDALHGGQFGGDGVVEGQLASQELRCHGSHSPHIRCRLKSAPARLWRQIPAHVHTSL